jgi:hypothetical protein
MRCVALIASFLLAVTAVGSTSSAVENVGRFKGEVVAKFLRDGRNLRLERPFGYVDPRGREWNGGEVALAKIEVGRSGPAYCYG